MSVLATHALGKRYGRVRAVDDLDLEVRAGDRFGFLGPNGSGKTTTVRMLLGLVLPTEGSVELFGAPLRRAELARVGALVEGPAFYGHLSGRANLRLLDAAGPGGPQRTRRTRIGEALEQVGLSGVDRRAVRAYSLGMKQRLGLAAALLRTPEVLVLDEPTNGLDPQGIREVRELLLALNASGTTVFLSSHLLSEVEALCTRIAVMDRGRMVLQDDLEAFRAPTGEVLVSTPDPRRALEVLGADAREGEGGAVLVRSTDPARVNAVLVQAGVPVAGLALQRRSLEQAVLAATGEGSDVRRREDRAQRGAAGSTSGGPIPDGTASGGPTLNAPTGSAPTGSAPTGSVPTGSAPTGSVPTGSVPTGSAPTGSVPDDVLGERPSRRRRLGRREPPVVVSTRARSDDEAFQRPPVDQHPRPDDEAFRRPPVDQRSRPPGADQPPYESPVGPP